MSLQRLYTYIVMYVIVVYNYDDIPYCARVICVFSIKLQAKNTLNYLNSKYIYIFNSRTFTVFELIALIINIYLRFKIYSASNLVNLLLQITYFL